MLGWYCLRIETPENVFPVVRLGGVCSTVSELTWHVVVVDLDISWLTILHLHILLHQQSVGVRLSGQLRPKDTRITD